MKIRGWNRNDDTQRTSLPAAVAVIELPLESWRNISAGKGVLKSISSPKE